MTDDQQSPDDGVWVVCQNDPESELPDFRSIHRSKMDALAKMRDYQYIAFYAFGEELF